MPGIVEKYHEIVAGIVDSPDIFIRASGYHLVSSVLGKHVYTPYIPRSRDAPFKPNLWVMISGLPGISRKSTLIGYERGVITDVFLRYYRERNPKLGEDKLKELVADMILQTGSPEGISDHISEKQGDVDEFILMSAEWGGNLRQMRGSKTYMEGLINLLSSLYSAEEIVWRGARKTRYIRSGLYVTAIVGIQDPALYLDKYMLEQGLLRRFLLVYATPRDRHGKWLPPISLEREIKVQQLDDIVDLLYEQLRAYSAVSPVLVTFEKDVIDAINNYARRVEEKIIEDPTANWSLYSQSLWEHLAKLSILQAIGTRKPTTGEVASYVTVTWEDYAKAEAFVIELEPNMKEAVSAIGARPVEASMTDYGAVLERIYSLIYSSGPEGITFQDLLRKTRLVKRKLNEYLSSLIAQGRVDAYIVNARRSTRIVLVSAEYRGVYSTVTALGKRVDSNVFNYL